MIEGQKRRTLEREIEHRARELADFRERLREAAPQRPDGSQTSNVPGRGLGS
ncbi:hypothetical protein TMPK1_12570 [Rhodospirillales bacterium TMPK1]|uniref:Uncharacterized protein n=1 Tax=Roseiterribacter gracilis TaxID=2812848 RepID=A0A8S8XCN8_9PROT|nr:hypothetical protein TMPK1_12570 [Rhodospirillales bacterium TMPK1]